MKKLSLLFSLMLIGSSAFAANSMYRCTLQGTQDPDSADLWLVVKSKTDVRGTWMPSENLETTKANVSQPETLEDGQLQFTLFAFQDKADMLVLPKGATDLPATMHVYTYTDNDDHAEDRQDFDCRK